MFRLSPCRHEGRFAVVTKRGAGCDGRLRRQCEQSCRRKRRGVRRNRVVLAPRPWRLSGPACLGAGNGDNKRRSPGRARISRKAIARGKPGCLGVTCGPCPCASACGMPVCSGARDLRVLPAPGLPCALCSREGQRISTTRVKTVPRERERMVLLSQLRFRLNPVSIRNKY